MQRNIKQAKAPGMRSADGIIQNQGHHGKRAPRSGKVVSSVYTGRREESRDVVEGMNESVFSNDRAIIKLKRNAYKRQIDPECDEKKETQMEPVGKDHVIPERVRNELRMSLWRCLTSLVRRIEAVVSVRHKFGGDIRPKNRWKEE